MGRLDFTIPDELETKLRIKVVERYGGRKGDLGKALLAAVQLWLKTEDK